MHFTFKSQVHYMHRELQYVLFEGREIKKSALWAQKKCKRPNKTNLTFATKRFNTAKNTKHNKCKSKREVTCYKYSMSKIQVKYTI